MILTSLLIYHVNKYLSNNKKKIMLLCAICTNVLIFIYNIIFCRKEISKCLWKDKAVKFGDFQVTTHSYTLDSK